MATISSIGTGSGIDLEGLIGQILEAERAPAERRLTLREAEAEASISGFGNLKSALDALRSTAQDLSDSDSVSLRATSSSDEEYVSISADNEALLGSHSIQVLNLANNHKVASGDFVSPADSVGTGTLTISVGNSSFELVIEAGVNDQLAQIRDAINEGAGEIGISASLITVDNGLGDGGTVSKLVLSADDGGEQNLIKVEVADDDGNNTDASGLSQLYFDNDDLAGSQLQVSSEAKDARITVDGFLARSSSNIFSNVLEGVEITALREPTDELDPETATVTIVESDTDIKNQVEAFITSYNDVFATINSLSSYDAATQSAGVLTGDAGVRQVETLLRRTLFSEVGDVGATFRNLASIGVTTERDGTLSINNDALQRAVDTDVEAVSQLISGDAGIMQRIDEVIEGFVTAGGTIPSRTEGLNQSLERIADQRETLQRRLDSIEARFRRQFSGLDTLIAGLQSTGNFLSQELSNIAAITRGN